KLFTTLLIATSLTLIYTLKTFKHLIPDMSSDLSLDTFREELSNELESILNYWITYSQDDRNGGFVGKIDNFNNVDFNAPKGSVLHARILWSFSAAFNNNPDEKYLEIAERAYNYIINYFV